MLLQFNFANFKSFRDPVSLDLRASKITDYEFSVRKEKNIRVLPTATIYGANASGKSSVYDAFVYMTRYIANSDSFGKTYKERDREFEISKPEQESFIFDKATKNGNSSFEAIFSLVYDKKKSIYKYGFEVNENEVVEEYLYKNDNIIFERNKSIGEFKINDWSIDLNEAIFQNLSKDKLVLSLVGNKKKSEFEAIKSWFLYNDYIDYGNVLENAVMSKVMPRNFLDINVQNRVIEYFKTFDESIKRFEVVEDEETKKIEIFTIRKIIGGGEAKLNLRTESDGTLKMFSMYQPLSNVLSRGSVLFIDELNGKLHPLLLRNIILLFTNKESNPKNAQLIFTTHDLSQLSNDVFRRDEIYFTEKNEDGVSSLYSLDDVEDDNGNKIRKDESFEKNYMFGKYGAIPILKKVGGFDDVK